MQDTVSIMFQQYFSSYFNSDNERKQFMTELNYEDEYNYRNSEEYQWSETEETFKSLLPYGNLKDFHIEIHKNATSFINQIYTKYIDDDTFVVSILEHDSIKNNVKKIENNLLILTYNMTKAFDVDTIIQKYKNSNCTKMFLYVAGIVESNIIPQAYYNKLKDRLIKENIPHHFVLDDVQSMFIVPRDYSIFDKVIFTCHSLIPHYNSGILLTKIDEHMGFKDSKPLDNFLILLKSLVLNKKDKIYIFKFIIEQYLADELSHNDIFYIPDNVSWNMFFLYIKKPNCLNKIIDRYKKDLDKNWINLYNQTFMIKANFILQLTPDEIINGFNKFKELLQKIIKLNKVLNE